MIFSLVEWGGGGIQSLSHFFPQALQLLQLLILGTKMYRFKNRSFSCRNGYQVPVLEARLLYNYRMSVCPYVRLGRNAFFSVAN